MARRSRAQRTIDDLEQQVQKTLINSPLEAVGALLLEILQGGSSAVTNGSTTLKQQNDVVTYVRQQFEALPKSFGGRFWLDSAIAQSIAEGCSSDEVRLSSMIVPRYGNEWGFLRVGIPYNGTQFQTVNVLIIPGSDDLTSIDLLDYPWLLHEIGHNIHFQSKQFADCFTPELEKVLQRLRVRSVSDRGIARQRATKIIDDFEEFWTPSSNHKNWPYEIAVDIVALWLCGPAFLAAFTHLISDQNPRPFDLTQHHPPYALRVSALIDAAKRLGWSNYTDGLKLHIQNWDEDSDSFEKTNRYRALSNEELLVTNVTCALSSCDKFGLPRLNAERLKTLQHFVTHPTECEFGVDIITTAWLAEVKLTNNDFEQWHQQVINELHRAVKPESQ